MGIALLRSVSRGLRNIERDVKLLWRLRGVHPRTCNICGYQGKFTAYGIQPRFDAQCRRCGSLERHRFFVLVLKGGDIRLDGPVLHFAPEESLATLFREITPDYVTADLSAPADLKLNIEQMTVDSGSFGTVVCNHVLEHVDDRKALAEIHRVLKPGGKLVVTVPIIEGSDHTYENPSVSGARQRKLHFGGRSHLRYYGRDFRQKLIDAGFTIVEYTADGPEVITHSLTRGEKVFIAAKAS